MVRPAAAARSRGCRTSAAGASPSSCTPSAPASPGGTATCTTWPSWRPGARANWARTSSWSTRCTRRSPVPPVSPSPYLPVTRMFTSPLYLRVEDIPEFGALARRRPGRDRGAGRAAARAQRHARSHRPGRGLAGQAARRLSSSARCRARRSGRPTSTSSWPTRGRDLEHWAAWCALAEIHGPDWRSWPAKYADPARGVTAVAAKPSLALRAAFHSWLQWQCEQQLGAAQQRAPPGRHAVRHHPRPGRRRAGGRRGRVGAPGAAGRGRERGRATGQLQPARPGLGAAAVAPAAARGGRATGRSRTCSPPRSGTPAGCGWTT